MNANTAENIKRLQDNSIDYDYYATAGRAARHDVIKSCLANALQLATHSAPLLPLFGLIVIVPFMIG